MSEIHTYYLLFFNNFNIFFNFQQLNSVGAQFSKILQTQKTFNTVVENGTGKNLIYKEILEGLSEQEKLSIISRSSLSKAEQIGAAITAGVSVENIKASISTTGLRIQTNALSTSQLGATITSSNLKLAIKGLGTEIKGLVSYVSIFLKAHPGLTGMAVTLALVAAAIKGVNAFQDQADGTTAVNKYNESLEKSEQTISDYNSEIETNKKKIEELQELQCNGTITDAQKTEIDNLKYQNALLDEKIEKLKQANDEELKAQTRTAENKFNTQFSESGDNTKSSNAKDVIERVSKNYSGDGSSNNMTRNYLTENKTLLIKNRKTEALNALKNNIMLIRVIILRKVRKIFSSLKTRLTVLKMI